MKDTGDERIIIWVSRCLLWLAAGVAAWWSGLFTFQPSWSPDWKTWSVLAATGFLSSIGGHLRGWLKGYRYGTAAVPRER